MFILFKAWHKLNKCQCIASALLPASISWKKQTNPRTFPLTRNLCKNNNTWGPKDFFSFCIFSNTDPITKAANSRASHSPANLGKNPSFWYSESTLTSTGRLLREGLPNAGRHKTGSTGRTSRADVSSPETTARRLSSSSLRGQTALLFLLLFLEFLKCYWVYKAEIM